MIKVKLYLFLAYFFFCIPLSSCFWETYSLNHLHNAEHLAEEHQYDEAIKEYRLHIETLENLDSRESWENPSFYRLKIGDLLLEKGEADAALAEILLADKEGIDKDSVSYRLRSVARWHEERGEFTTAISLLNQFRDRDPLLFNALLDEIARKQAALQFKK